MKKIHIATSGKDTGHLFNAFQELKIDELYLITSEKFKENAEEVKEKLKTFNVETHIKLTEPFKKDSLQKILDTILEIIKEHRQDEININISGGTNLMGAAALIAAYFTKSNAYYLLDPRFSEDSEKVIFLPVPKISYFDALSETKKEIMLKIVSEIQKEKIITNIHAFAEKIGRSQQSIKPHLEDLKNKGLIFINKKKKEHTIQLTKSGEIILSFIK